MKTFIIATALSAISLAAEMTHHHEAYTLAEIEATAEAELEAMIEAECSPCGGCGCHSPCHGGCPPQNHCGCGCDTSSSSETDPVSEPDCYDKECPNSISPTGTTQCINIIGMSLQEIMNYYDRNQSKCLDVCEFATLYNCYCDPWYDPF